MLDKDMKLGYSEEGHKEDWCGRRGCKGQSEIVADCTATEKKAELIISIFLKSIKKNIT